MPSIDGEPVFAEPWQGRAFALAVETVERLGVGWDEFRAELMAAIDRHPQRPYYESWLEALERFTLSHNAAEATDLSTQRMRAASYRLDEPGNGDIEIFPIQVNESVLHGILESLFTRWWRNIRFGIIIQGAVFELRAAEQPTLSMLDGYLTLDFGPWHAHLCIGEHRGTTAHPVTPQVAHLRQCAHAELARIFADGSPTSWMFRMYNGASEQQLTVLLPNPFLDDDQHPLTTPDWSRLDCWDELRRNVLGLDPDSVDRSGGRFVHP